MAGESCVGGVDKQIEGDEKEEVTIQGGCREEENRLPPARPPAPSATSLPPPLAHSRVVSLPLFGPAHAEVLARPPSRPRIIHYASPLPPLPFPFPFQDADEGMGSANIDGV
jgi:hypothetical protein